MSAQPAAHLEIVLEAADHRARELLGQAAKYEALASVEERRTGRGQMIFATETLEKHYRPLREAIDTLRAVIEG